jgi:dienelactone hydrolase
MWPRRAASFAALTVVAPMLFVAASCLPSAAEPAASRAEDVIIPLNPLPFDVKGYLRRPEGAGPFPGVILIPACDRFVNVADQDWGASLSSWGYVALTLDVFTPHGVPGHDTCLDLTPLQIGDDVYRGLNLLVERRLVDPERVFLLGFGRGGSLAFAAIDRGGIVQRARHKFRAAIAFYPGCGDVKGVMTVPTLVVLGARDERKLDGCRKMAEGEDDMGISRQRGAGAPIRLVVLPDAYSGFDLPAFQKPAEINNVRVEYNKAAAEQAKEVLREFLQSR